MTQQPAPTYPVYVRASNGLATASLVLGIIAVVLALPVLLTFSRSIGVILAIIPALLGIVALSLGHAGRSVAKKTGVGRGASKAGIILGYISLCILPALYALMWVGGVIFG